jgi:hypothetical protein
MMNKPRAQINGRRPAARVAVERAGNRRLVEIAPTVDLDSVVAETRYGKFVSPEFAKLHKPYGHSIALPLQAHRINTLFVSKTAIDKVGSTTSHRLGRVQRTRPEDEGGRHRPARPRRHPLGRPHEVGERT